MVRKGGLEPPRYCYRQPLKLVRLPVPPLPRGCYRAGAAGVFCAGGGDAGVDVPPGAAGVGAAGFGVAGAEAGERGAGVPVTTDPEPLRWPMMLNASAPTMNNTAAPVVIFDSTVAPVRAPNAA